MNETERKALQKRINEERMAIIMNTARQTARNLATRKGLILNERTLATMDLGQINEKISLMDKLHDAEPTTEALKAELEEAKKSNDFSAGSWDRIFGIEKELRNRGQLTPAYYNED